MDLEKEEILGGEEERVPERLHASLLEVSWDVESSGVLQGHVPLQREFRMIMLRTGVNRARKARVLRREPGFPVNKG